MHGMISYLYEDLACFILGQSSFRLDVRTQVSTVKTLHNQMHALRGFNCLVQTRDTRMGDTLHDFDLCSRG